MCVVVFHFPLNITQKCRDRKVPTHLQVYCECRSPPVTLSLLSWPQRRKRLVSFWQEIRLRTELWGEADKLHVWCLICINLSNFSEENRKHHMNIVIKGSRSCHLFSGQLQYFWHTINVRSRLPQCNAWTMVGVNVIEICRNPLHVYLLVSSKYTFIYKMLWNLSCVSTSGVRQNTFHLLRS